MKKKIKILVVIKEKSLLKQMKSLLSNMEINEIVSEDNAANVLESIFSKYPPDLVIINDKIEGKLSGLEIAKKISFLKIPFFFILNQNQSLSINKISNINCLGFLAKPISITNLKTCLSLLLKLIKSGNQDDGKNAKFERVKDSDIFFIRHNNLLKRIFLKEIIYIKSEGNYSLVKTTDNRFLVKSSLTKVEDEISDGSFIRIHKGYLVKLEKIEDIALTESIVKIEGETIPLGRSYRNNLLEKITRIL